MSREILKKFKAISASIAENQRKDKQALWQQGEDLLKELRHKRYLRKMPLEMLNVDYYCLLPIIDYFLCEKINSGNIPSPIENEKNSNWMTESSFCFLNVRACGKNPQSAGDLINAAKLLLSLRVESIHLAPFFSCDLSIIYNINSHETIDETIINRDFLDNGMNGVEQLQFLVAFTHLIGKKIGFDLEPHTSQFSRVAIQDPSLFRWLQLDKDKNRLINGLSQEEILEPALQQLIYIQVKKIRDDVLSTYGLDKLEYTIKSSKAPEERPDREQCIKNAHEKIVTELKNSGIWTIPSHTWGGAGLPRFTHFNHYQDYPEFEYISIQGEDHKDHAFGVLTPFRFYDGLPINESPTSNSQISLNAETIDYFANIITKVRKWYPFDFVRFDFVDHVFDLPTTSTSDGCETPKSDRLTPGLLKYVINKIRSDNGINIGTIAERMGNNIDQYASCGFDLILGDDFLHDLHEIPEDKPEKINLEKTLNISMQLGKANVEQGKRASICYTIDTHDRENSLFKLPPILGKGIYGIALRHFVSRFGSAGFGQRPKYEIIGNQDGTEGLYSAIRYGRPIQWRSNKELNEIYHNIEDVFDELQDDYIRVAKIQDVVSYFHYVVCWKLVANNFTIVAVSNTSPYRSFCDIAVYPDFEYVKAIRLEPYFKVREEVDRLVINSLLPMHSMLFLLKTSHSIDQD